MFLSLYGLLIVRSNHEAHALNKCEMLCCVLVCCSGFVSLDERANEYSLCCAWIPFIFFVALKIHSHLVWFKLFCCRFLFGECLFCVSELRYLDFFFFGFRPKLAYLTMFYVYFSQFYFFWFICWSWVTMSRYLTKNPKVKMLVRV